MAEENHQTPKLTTKILIVALVLISVIAIVLGCLPDPEREHFVCVLILLITAGIIPLVLVLTKRK